MARARKIDALREEGRKAFDVLNRPGSATRQFADWRRNPGNPPPAVKAAIERTSDIQTRLIQEMDPEMRKRLAEGD